MVFLFKKQKKIINKIEEYISCTDMCRDRFLDCMDYLIKEKHTDRNNRLVESVHIAESEADDLKREIEHELYKKALIPESRGDVLGLLETFDKIPNILESICFQISLENIIIPEKYQNNFFKLIKINIESYNILKKAVMGLFYNNDVITEMYLIDLKESESDRIERLLIKNIFASQMNIGEKLLLKEIVINIGNISDRAQVVSDRLALAIIKRRT